MVFHPRAKQRTTACAGAPSVVAAGVPARIFMSGFPAGVCPGYSDVTTMRNSGIHSDITHTMGNTPLIALNRLSLGLPGRVVVKHEGFNPFGSIKDRIGLAMIDHAAQQGELRPGSVIVEATSGNTGIGVAYAASVRGYRCVITMPETMTVERQLVLRALGCKVILTPAEQGLQGALDRASRIAERLGDRAWMLRQTENPVNPLTHYLTTGPEIWRDTAGTIDVLVATVGTGGTITGTGRYLRERKPGIHIVATEPRENPLLSGGPPGVHRQVGLFGPFLAATLDTHIYDEVVQVSDEDAFATTRRLAREEAILAGISSGSATWAALQIAAREEHRGKLIVAILPDTGERYLSHPVYAEQPERDFSDLEDAICD